MTINYQEYIQQRRLTTTTYTDKDELLYFVVVLVVAHFLSSFVVVLGDISGVSRTEPSFAVSGHVVGFDLLGAGPTTTRMTKGDNNQPTLENNKDDDANDK